MTNTVQLPNNQMIFSVQELKDKGFSYYKINQMVDKGILVKLNKNYYENANFDGEESDFLLCLRICTRRSGLSAKCSCVL